MGLSTPIVFIIKLLSKSSNYVHEEQFAVQTAWRRNASMAENLKTIVLGFWAESGKGIQEKTNQPEQPGAFARLVVSIVCDLFCTA